MTTYAQSTITFPYRRSVGPVTGAFLSALTEKRILGTRNGDTVFVPPMEWNPANGAELPRDLVEVGPAARVESWTWVPTPSVQHPLDRPFAFAFIRLDGASNPLLHAVDAGSPDAMSDGMRVAPRWRAERVGHITDIECFVPGETPETNGVDGGSAEQPVTMMDYVASITYSNPVTLMAERANAAALEHRLLGVRCPVCDRVYVAAGDRAQCPIDSLVLGPEHEVELSQIGTITNFAVVSPTQYPGQTETETFARVFVLLDGFDVVLGYQGVVDLPVPEVKIGKRVRAVWGSPDFRGGGDRAVRGLLGWSPTGEPDIDNPDLVNRIY